GPAIDSTAQVDGDAPVGVVGLHRRCGDHLARRRARSSLAHRRGPAALPDPRTLAVAAGGRHDGELAGADQRARRVGVQRARLRDARRCRGRRCRGRRWPDAGGRAL
ncbi:MAG: hypothetical protein AVDCRST_MAG32-2557, partial [uncultured Nocardioides sp.]